MVNRINNIASSGNFVVFLVCCLILFVDICRADHLDYIYCHVCTECETPTTVAPCPGKVCVKIITNFGSIHRVDRICHHICPSSVSDLVQQVKCCSTELCNSGPQLSKLYYYPTVVGMALISTSIVIFSYRFQ